MTNRVALIALAVSCAHHPRTGRWLGYAEGEDVLVAAPLAGWVTSVEVARGQQVAVGDVLFTLDDTEQRKARDNAAAQVAAARDQRAQAQADLGFANKELDRNKALVESNSLATRDLDQAKSSVQSNSARVSQGNANEAAAKASLATAEWNLSERTVRARAAGRVEDVYFRAGEYATASAPVVAILPPPNVYARFFVPESELSALHPDDVVTVTCDGCAKDLMAKVTFIAHEAEFTPPVIYSKDTRQKLMFKVEARASQGLPLRPGLPLTVTRAVP